MNVLGLDLSLTSTGYAYRVPPNHASGQEIVTGRILSKHLRGPERLWFLEGQLVDILTFGDPFTLAVIEGYAMGFGGKNPGRVFDIGEWGGVARLCLFEHGVPIVIVSPSSLKMFATGNGGAAIKKPQVIAAIKEVWNYQVDQDDEADAFVAMMLGEAYLNKRKRRKYNANQIRALDKIEYIEPVAPGFRI